MFKKVWALFELLMITLFKKSDCFETFKKLEFKTKKITGYKEPFL